ncbi:MAG: ribosome-associated translation inhibitor RaiA [bacterium]
MNIQISNRHASAEPEMKQHVEDGLQSLEGKYEILGAEVILDHEGHAKLSYNAEINLKVKGALLHAKESSDTISKAFDSSVKVLESQLKKHKDTHYSSIELKRKAIKK